MIKYKFQSALSRRGIPGVLNNTIVMMMMLIRLDKAKHKSLQKQGSNEKNIWKLNLRSYWM